MDLSAFPLLKAPLQTGYDYRLQIRRKKYFSLKSYSKLKVIYLLDLQHHRFPFHESKSKLVVYCGNLLLDAKYPCINNPRSSA